MGTEAKYLVYSREHNAWWGPNGAGYRVQIAEAGRYTLEEATCICAAPMHRGGDSGDGPTEFYVLSPECAMCSSDLLGEAVEALANLRKSSSDLVKSIEMAPGFADSSVELYAWLNADTAAAALLAKVQP